MSRRTGRSWTRGRDVPTYMLGTGRVGNADFSALEGSGTPKPSKYTSAFADWFWAKLDARGECWIWSGGKNEFGYGLVVAKTFGVVRQFRAHRVAWELIYGTIPTGLLVCHDCPGGDEPACCNPAHLFLGTHADNSRDMAAKGRQVFQVHPDRSARGERNAKARLTWALVREVRQRFASGGITRRDLAYEYGVSVTAMQEVIAGRSWKESEDDSIK